MSTKMMIELFGYLGSALVVVSMLMTSVYRLRIINMIGSIIFAIYALIIKSYPTALMNFFLVGINIYHLMRLRNQERHYDLVELDGQEGYLQFLLKYYLEDIRKYFPDFAPEKARELRSFLVCCDSEAAGMLIGEEKEKGKLELLLDYSTPVYRDCSVGEYLYGRLPKYGIRSLIYRGTNQDHVEYVGKMGFKKVSGDVFEKIL